MEHQNSISDDLENFLKEIHSKHEYQCHSLSDKDFIMNGLIKVGSLVSSGRDFLQYISEKKIAKISRSTLFDALNSERRGRVVRDYSLQFYEQMRHKIKLMGVDYLSEFPELEKCNIISGDGHFIEHASHAKRHPETHRLYAAGTIFIKDLRTGLMYPLAVAGYGPKKNNEMKIFRNNSDFPTNTICVLDKAYIDNNFWNKKLIKNNITFISMKKESHVVIENGSLSFDAHDMVNNGVIADKYIAFSGGQTLLRMIVYIDPETGKKYEFITTIMDQKVRPGTIAHLYFLRWQIEKSYDVFKNELKEKKAWVTSEIGTEMQSHFISIYFNFLLFLQEKLKNITGVGDKKSEEKHKKDLKKRNEKAQKKGGYVRGILLNFTNRLARLSAQFIRLVRNLFFLPMPEKRLCECYIERAEGYL